MIALARARTARSCRTRRRTFRARARGTRCPWLSSPPKLTGQGIRTLSKASRAPSRKRKDARNGAGASRVGMGRAGVLRGADRRGVDALGVDVQQELDLTAQQLDLRREQRRQGGAVEQRCELGP